MITNSFTKAVVQPSNETIIKLGKRTVLNPLLKFYLLQHDDGFSYVAVNDGVGASHILMVTTLAENLSG
jgi:hypothetical protein